MSETLRVRTAGDLIGHLMSPDINVRLAMLEAIRRNPEAALALGKENGRDVIDELVHQGYQDIRYALWKAVVETLACFTDQRATVFFLKILTVSQYPEAIRIAAEYLARVPKEPLHGHLSVILRRDGNQERARAAAHLLAGSEALTPAEQVRAQVLLASESAAPAAFEPEHVDAWLAELRGQFAPQAREHLETQGEPAFLAVRERWDRLGEAERAWILEWGAREHPLHAVELLRRALEEGPDAVTLAALAQIPRLGPAAALFAPAVERLQAHPSEGVRAAAAAIAGSGEPAPLRSPA